jgi:hypothetical protein
VRHESGTAAVLKVPLHAADFAGRHDARDLAALARSACEAQRDLLAARPYPELAPLLGLVDDAPAHAASAAGGYFLPRLPSDLDTRLRAGLSLQEAIAAIGAVTSTLRRAGTAHANLRPSNIFLADEGRIVLTDPHTPIDATVLRRLSDALAPRPAWVPPEVQRGAVEASGERAAMTDTWSLCQLLLGVLRGVHGDPGHRTLADNLRDGLGRSELALVKDAGADAVAASDVPRRFAGRVTERLGAILSRGLSEADEPSPPYRFATLADLEARMVEVVDLMRPEVRHVSRPLLSSRAKDGAFDTGHPVAFTVNVTTSSGVVAPDDVVVGFVLRDLDAQGDNRVRAPGARVDVQRHHSGRWRYAFEIPDVMPGRYLLKVGVRIQDEPGTLVEAEGNFTVRPSAGYVPPSAATEPVEPTATPRRATLADTSAVSVAAPAPTRASAEPQEATATSSTAAAMAAASALPDLFGRASVGGPPVPIRPDSRGTWSGVETHRDGFDRNTDAGTEPGTRWYDAAEGPPTLRSAATTPTIAPTATSPGTDPAWSVPARPSPSASPRASSTASPAALPPPVSEPPAVLRPSTGQHELDAPRATPRPAALDYPSQSQGPEGDDLSWQDESRTDDDPDLDENDDPEGPLTRGLAYARERLAAWEAEGWDANTVIAGFAVAVIMGVALVAGLIKSFLAG